MDKPDSESVKHADRATNGGRPRVYERATIPSPRIIKFERGSTIVGRRPAETHHPSKPPSKPTLSGLQSPNHVEGSSAEKISRPDKPNSAAQPTSDPAGGPSVAPNRTTPQATTPLAKESEKAGSRAVHTDDDQLRRIANKLGDIFVYHRDAWNSDQDLGVIALSNLRNQEIRPPLDEYRFRRMLSFLPKDVRHLFFRSTRDQALLKYLQGLGLSWEEMFKEDEPTAGDWIQFATGALGGFGFGLAENELGLIALIHSLLGGIYVTVGQIWDPKLAETFDNFTSALGQLIRHPITSASKKVEGIRKGIEEELMNRQYRKAGFLFGQIIPEVIALKDMGHLGITFAKALPRLALTTIREMKLLKEFARFYLSTKTRDVLPNGSTVQKIENMIVVSSAKGNKSVLDLSLLAADDRIEWDHALASEQKVDVAPKEPNATATDTPARSEEPAGRPSVKDRLNDRLVNGDPRTKARDGRATNHSPETKPTSRRGKADEPLSNGAEERGIPRSPEEAALEESLTRAKLELREVASKDISYKAQRQAKGFSQKGGKWHKLRYNLEERISALKRLILNPELTILEQAVASAIVYPNGVRKPLTEMGLDGREWDWAEHVDGNRWRLNETKSVDEITGSVEGGLKRLNRPIEGRYSPNSKVGQQIENANRIFEEMEKTGGRLELIGKNLRTGTRQPILLGLDEIRISLTGYDITGVQ